MPKSEPASPLVGMCTTITETKNTGAYRNGESKPEVTKNEIFETDNNDVVDNEKDSETENAHDNLHELEKVFMITLEHEEDAEMSGNPEEEQETQDQRRRAWQRPYQNVSNLGSREDGGRREIEVCTGREVGFRSMESPHEHVATDNYADHSNQVANAWTMTGPERLEKWELLLAPGPRVTRLQTRASDQPELSISGLKTPSAHWIYKYEDQEVWVNKLEGLDYHMLQSSVRKSLRRSILNNLRPEFYDGFNCMLGSGQDRYQVFKHYL